MRVGIISDTHGLVRPEALHALRESELLIHAGDIGKREVLDNLASIAPVVAVRGNVDRDSWAERLPLETTLELDGNRIHLVHNINDLHPDHHGCTVIVSGHSHRPSIRRENGVLFVNPGSAGPRRFKLPVAVARLRIEHTRIEPEIVELLR